MKDEVENDKENVHGKVIKNGTFIKGISKDDQPGNYKFDMFGPDSIGASQRGPVNVYSTPVGQAIRKMPMANAQITGTPFGSHLKVLINGASGNGSAPPTTEKPSIGRTPRSRSKGQALPRRVFNSMERKVDRMITALTPKRYRAPTPIKMRHTQTLVNVSTIHSRNEEQVLNELLRIFTEKGITCTQKGWTIRGKTKDADGRTTLTFELEVVYVESLKMVGIRRKRLNGPSFMYKRICEDILNLAGV